MSSVIEITPSIRGQVEAALRGPLLSRTARDCYASLLAEEIAALLMTAHRLYGYETSTDGLRDECRREAVRVVTLRRPGARSRAIRRATDAVLRQLEDLRVARSATAVWETDYQRRIADGAVRQVITAAAVQFIGETGITAFEAELEQPR